VHEIFFFLGGGRVRGGVPKGSVPGLGGWADSVMCFWTFDVLWAFDVLEIGQVCGVDTVSGMDSG
jgi:hypothetical protein